MPVPKRGHVDRGRLAFRRGRFMLQSARDRGQIRPKHRGSARPPCQQRGDQAVVVSGRTAASQWSSFGYCHTAMARNASASGTARRAYIGWVPKARPDNSPQLQAPSSRKPRCLVSFVLRFLVRQHGYGNRCVASRRGSGTEAGACDGSVNFGSRLRAEEERPVDQNLDTRPGESRDWLTLTGMCPQRPEGRTHEDGNGRSPEARTGDFGGRPWAYLNANPKTGERSRPVGQAIREIVGRPRRRERHFPFLTSCWSVRRLASSYPALVGIPRIRSWP